MLSVTFAALLSYPFLLLRLQNAAGSFPKPLTAEEEREYVARCVQGDVEARNILIERNLRLVAHIIKKYYTSSCDQDDLISIGTIGLIKGVSTYRPEKGTRLATYASRCIENEILMYFRSQRKTAGDVSLSDSLDAEGETGGLSLFDVVCVEDDILEEISSQELYGQLRRCIDSVLTERERQIIELRYGLNGKRRLTQREAADACGISRSYISRIEKKALEKLRRALDGD